MAKGKADPLVELHSMLCKELTRRLKKGDEMTAADLNVVRQFLKDNNVDGLPREESPLGEVLKSLPERFLQH